MSEHAPDEFLMRQILAQLLDCPKSIAKLHQRLNRNPIEIRQALSDLIHYGQVCQSYDGYRFELAYGGYNPGPEAA